MTETGQPHIVTVDDDALFLRTLTLNLEDAGYKVTAFTDGLAAIVALDGARAPDALMLDCRMPSIDGLELLRRFRAAGIAAPAIFLTSVTEPIFEELALNQGAVDFVDKSRSFAIILKRLELVIAGRKGASLVEVPNRGDDEVRTAGALILVEEARRARWRGREVALSLAEYAVVAHLAARPGADVSYRALYDLVRGQGFVAGEGEEGYRANVRAMIKRIRRKFAEVDPAFDALENYPGFGYRWKRGSDVS